MAGIRMASDDDDRKKVVPDIDDEDELFELDIDLLDGHRGHYYSAAVADDGQQQHALLANCLLPARSVSNAVPVDASSALSSYPYSGYYSSRRLVLGGGVGRRFLLGRPGNSARFCFSSRGFDAYFQRY
ncbi:hypothetical protein SETIT_7G324700v2 [Setaria italica]|uniref:Uncharacterized protein n=1 Tax=Setaria italica TaxID=4555 RepID=K3YAS6_SETIT|nr:uncharacterized protein LOC101780474 [Setaria italica]RCV36512.1 hypothetical protein SETIT_7G324700v2 [Setaria italica]RCV36513.1 hypothetical protein SETIT_7G324700v2 [Setaria italica]